MLFFLILPTIKKLKNMIRLYTLHSLYNSNLSTKKDYVFTVIILFTLSLHGSHADVTPLRFQATHFLIHAAHFTCHFTSSSHLVTSLHRHDRSLPASSQLVTSLNLHNWSTFVVTSLVTSSPLAHFLADLTTSKTWTFIVFQTLFRNTDFR